MFATTALPVRANCVTDFAADDSTLVTVADSAKIAKKSFFTKFLDYFNDANKEKKNKKFDFSVIGGPHYSTDTKLGLGLVAAGLYRTDRTDSLLSPSNVSFFSVMCRQWDSGLSEYGAHTFRRRTSTVCSTLYISTHFPPTSGEWAMSRETILRTRAR